ncbi:hypothetical protein RUM44_005201 [Polyplax serrata]|uniref:Uncharacterized protein n=1 Tax=Polyplax serrata TaxID=468196 RepID=A0ABR1AEC6_POLSC
MSRPNIKSRLPNKTNSRPGLYSTPARVTGELSGQPSIRNTKEDIKYWKSREQELLTKIAELENKVSGKDPKTQENETAQEKCENSPAVVTSREKLNKSKPPAADKELQSQKSDGNTKNLKSSEEVINHLKIQNDDLRNALSKMTTILRDKTTTCITQEKKIAALLNQVESLKEVVAITKDLLNIRNMEVQHLSNDISSMETKIDCERQRHNQMLIKMDEAVKLNSELKKEYENQLRLFQHLRDSYEEKILLLSRDNKQKNENLVLEKSTLNSNKNNPDPQLQGSTP